MLFTKDITAVDACFIAEFKKKMPKNMLMPEVKKQVDNTLGNYSAFLKIQNPLSRI